MIDAYTKRRAMIDRSACKGCKRENDRACTGGLGGLFCSPCLQARRGGAEKRRRDNKGAEIAAAGGVQCKFCYSRAVEPGTLKCQQCRERIEGADDDANPHKDGQGCKSTRQRQIVAEMLATTCARCHLRGPHECLTDAATSRRSGWENMVRA
jgi:hypothetical protein